MQGSSKGREDAVDINQLLPIAHQFIGLSKHWISPITDKLICGGHEVMIPLTVITKILA